MIKVEKGQSLYSAYRKTNAGLSSFCGGNKHCGKCKVKIVEGYLDVNETDRKYLNEKELALGIRLACAHENIESSITILPILEYNNYRITGISRNILPCRNENGLVAGVDIGTTTVVAAFYDANSGELYKEFSFLNPQKSYGADVISRIQACRTYGVQSLQECLLKELKHCISSIGKDKKLLRMCVCGNPVMTHIFMGEDPWSIGQAPYTCPIDALWKSSSQKLFPELEMNFEIQVLPPISAYVGSDVVMGLYSTKISEDKKIRLFIDLGTNGELALYKDNRFICSSAACGPAFEGGNMKCGTGAIKGAMEDVKWKLDHWEIKTIGDEKLIGICGSGYIALLDALLNNGMLEKSGYLKETVKLDENIVVTQKDIREFQLARSAVVSAIQCLCEEQRCSIEDIEEIILAGGFGRHIDLSHCIGIHLFPQVWKTRMNIVGNSAILGVCQYALLQDQDYVENIITKSESVLLANNPKFSTAFLENLNL